MSRSSVIRKLLVFMARTSLLWSGSCEPWQMRSSHAEPHVPNLEFRARAVADLDTARLEEWPMRPSESRLAEPSGISLFCLDFPRPDPDGTGATIDG